MYNEFLTVADNTKQIKLCGVSSVIGRCQSEAKKQS